MSRRSRRHGRCKGKNTPSGSNTKKKPRPIHIKKKTQAIPKRKPVIRKTRRKAKNIASKSKTLKVPAPKNEALPKEEISEEVEACDVVEAHEQDTAVQDTEMKVAEHQEVQAQDSSPIIHLVPLASTPLVIETLEKSENDDDTKGNAEGEAIQIQEQDSLEMEDSSRLLETPIKNEKDTSSSSGGIACSTCNEEVDSPVSLAQHMKENSSCNQIHKCLLCSKILSSASSLDRHMLVHSGERPFKCKICDMAFTTNGNMHRHMRTHGEASESSSSTKGAVDLRKRDFIKRKLSYDDAHRNDGYPASGAPEKEKLHCPVCGKSFLCKYGLQSHMETHPNDPILCQSCGEVSTNYDLHINHACDTSSNQMKKLKGCLLTYGFQDLNFMDFTANKFSLVSKAFCEQNIKRPTSAFHAFECSKCSKAFPCTRALKLHQNVHQTKSGTFCPSCDCNFEAPSLLQLHQLKHRCPEHCVLTPQVEGAEHEVPEASNTHKSEEGKEDFLALFNLQTKDSHLELLKELRSYRKIKEDNFENMDYFVHGRIRGNLVHNSCRNPDNGNNDFADIQSIISLTSKAPPITAVQTSPISIRAISPINVISPELPESPQLADSPNASPKIPSNDTAVQPPANRKTVPLTPVTSVNKIYSCKPLIQSYRSCILASKSQGKHMSQKCSKYSCHLCSYISVDKSTLIRHLRTHNGERPFQCTICKYPFTTKANCERHVRKRHKKLTKPEIRSCMQYNPNMALKAMDMDPDISNSETVCKYCNVDFKFNRVLRHHLRSLHNSCNRKPFSCKICSFGFSTKNNCIRHILKQHPSMKDKLRSVVVPNPLKDSHHDDASDKQSDCDLETSLSSTTPSAVNEPTVFTNEQTEPLNLNVGVRDEPLNLRTNGISDALSSIEAVVAAEGLVSLSEASPIQEEPLDLAVRPLDLSCKSQPSALDMCISKSTLHNGSAPHVYQTQFTTNPSCSYVDLTTTQKIIINPSVNPSGNRKSMLPSTASSVILRAANVVRPFGQKFRAFTCIYCSAGFTLKSNMERHVKRKHPEFARPTRSRNYIPTVNAHRSERHNINMLSDRTRDALRYVLSNKVQQSPSHSSHNITDVYDAHKAAIYAHSLSADSSKQVNSAPFVIRPTTSQERFPESANRLNTNKSFQSTDEENEKFEDSIATAQSEKFECFTRKPTEKAAKSKLMGKSCVNLGRKGDLTSNVACPFCARKFPWSSSLRRHILTHTGQKPYKCPLCCLWFTTKSNCERHLLRKHGQKGDLISRTVPDRPYKCNHCPTSTFATQGNLRKHFYLKHWTRSCLGMNSKIINKEECTSNPRNSQDSASSESSGQTKENTSVCSFCDESFDDLAQLSDHMLKHSNVGYVCYLCQKTFTTSQSCYSHFKTSHSLVYLQLVKSDVNMGNSIPPEQGDNKNSVVVDNEIETKEAESIPFMACMICHRKLTSLDSLQQHVKQHLETSKASSDDDQEKIAVKSAKNIPNPGASKNCDTAANADKRVNPKNKVQNSLLYLYNPTLADGLHSPSSSKAKNDASKPEEESDLIQNLLGIQDSKMMDELLVSADSAARLLGVKEV